MSKFPKSKEISEAFKRCQNLSDKTLRANLNLPIDIPYSCIEFHIVDTDLKVSHCTEVVALVTTSKSLENYVDRRCVDIPYEFPMNI